MSKYKKIICLTLFISVVMFPASAFAASNDSASENKKGFFTSIASFFSSITKGNQANDSKNNNSNSNSNNGNHNNNNNGNNNSNNNGNNNHNNNNNNSNHSDKKDWFDWIKDLCNKNDKPWDDSCFDSKDLWKNFYCW